MRSKTQNSKVKSQNYQQGMSLIEALVAFMVLSIMGTAIVFLTLQVLAANNAARLRNQVTDYGQEAMEQLRGYEQNNGWAKMATLASGSVCYKDGRLDSVANNTTTCGRAVSNQIGQSVFNRYIKLTLVSASQLSAQVFLFWTERGVTRETEIDTDFYTY